MENNAEPMKRIAAAFFGDERHRELCFQAIRKALREIPARSEHGYVLSAEHMQYGDLLTPGSVTILVRNHGVKVEVADFEWRDGGSCREQVTKGMCWARDVINAAIESNRIVPGGDITSVEASSPVDGDPAS